MNCDMCSKDCSVNFMTADCTYHYYCNICTAVFLDGMSRAPACQKCWATEVYKRYTKTRSENPTKSKAKLKLSTRRQLSPIQDKTPSFPAPTLDSGETLTPTDSHLLGSDLSERMKKNSAEANVKQPVSHDIPFTIDKGSVIYKVDMFTGKMVRFFPYIPKKIKNSSETVKQKFDEVSPPTKEEMSNEVAVKLNIPSNSSSCAAGTDMQYIDNLFSFLREEKSKRQVFAVPSIKSRYHPDELEFNMNRGGSCSTSCSSQNTLGSKKSNKAPVLTTLLSQLQPDTEDDADANEEATNESGMDGGLQGQYEDMFTSDKPQVNYEMTLLLERSISPASDVKGEYGSEDDKLSISSESGSGGLEAEECIDSGSEMVQKSSDMGPQREHGQERGGYNADAEEERCSSPCKGSKLSHHKGSYDWDQDNDIAVTVPTLPEPPARHAAAGSSSSEEDSAEIQGLKSSTSTSDSQQDNSQQHLLSEEPSTSSQTRHLPPDRRQYRGASPTNAFEDDGFWDQ